MKKLYKYMFTCPRCGISQKQNSISNGLLKLEYLQCCNAGCKYALTQEEIGDTAQRIMPGSCLMYAHTL